MSRVQAPASETLFCCLCRRAACRCGSEMAFARRPAALLRAGDDLVEADGCLLTVVGVEPVAGSRDVVVTISSFGPSRVGPLRVSPRKLFSVAVRRPSSTEAA